MFARRLLLNYSCNFCMLYGAMFTGNAISISYIQIVQKSISNVYSLLHAVLCHRVENLSVMLLCGIYLIHCLLSPAYHQERYYIQAKQQKWLKDEARFVMNEFCSDMNLAFELVLVATYLSVLRWFPHNTACFLHKHGPHFRVCFSLKISNW